MELSENVGGLYDKKINMDFKPITSIIVQSSSLRFLIFSAFIANFPTFIHFLFVKKKKKNLREVCFFSRTFALFSCCGLHCCNPFLNFI